MKKTLSAEVKSRLLTFAWSVWWVVLAALVDGIVANLGVLELPNQYVVVIGLALAQVSKYAHNKKAGKV
jgi:hypothetical protein